MSKRFQHRILVAAQRHTHGEREMLRGFHIVGGEKNWFVLNVPGTDGLEQTLQSWEPHVCVVSPETLTKSPASLWKNQRIVGMNVNSRQWQIPCVRPDDPAAGEQAATHLLEKGFTTFTAFGFNDYPWLRERINSFRKAVESGGGKYLVEQPFVGSQPNITTEIGKWARALPKGTAILAGCDDWGALLVLSCRQADIAVPEDLAVVGIDDDDLICEMCQPHLSSVRLPWQEIGRATARMVDEILRTQNVETKIVRVAPAGVIERRSTELLAVGNPVVAEAIRFLRARAHEPVTVGEVVDHVTTHRRWLERAFRKFLGHSILQEIRHSRLDRARHLLATTDWLVPIVARRCGFNESVSRFSRTFHAEVGMTPTQYRRNFTLHK